jgi:hypothetical protein
MDDKVDTTAQLSCGLLIPWQADEIKRYILRFFALLSVADPSAHVIIVESQSVIPSITSYLYGLSAIVWQGAEELESDPKAASR